MTYDGPPAQPPGTGPVVSGWILPEPFRGSPTFRSARRRVRIAAVLLGLATLQAVAEGIHLFDGLAFADRARGGFVSLGEALEFDGTTQTLDMIAIAVTVVTAIAFLAWLSRAIDNVYPLRLAVPALPATPRAAIGWWFVPLASYVMPYRIVADLQRRVAGPDRDPWLVRLWWAAWLGQTFMSFASLAIRYGSPTGIDSMRRIWGLLAAAEAVRAIAGVFAILVIVAIDAAMERQARAVAVSTLAVP